MKQTHFVILSPRYLIVHRQRFWKKNVNISGRKLHKGWLSLQRRDGKKKGDRNQILEQEGCPQSGGLRRRRYPQQPCSYWVALKSAAYPGTHPRPMRAMPGKTMTGASKESPDSEPSHSLLQPTMVPFLCLSHHTLQRAPRRSCTHIQELFILLIQRWKDLFSVADHAHLKPQLL